MTPEAIKQLRGHYHALQNQERSLTSMGKSASGGIIDEGVVASVEQEIAAVDSLAKGLLPPFDRRQFFSHDVGRGAYYKLPPLLMYVAGAVGRLQVAIEADVATPVTETRAFDYLTDPKLKIIVSRDYREAQRAYIAECWKSTIILSGGLIEAILLDMLKKDPARATAASSAPSKPDLSRWDLSELIKVAVEVGLVGSAVQKLSHSVREFRNLVHAGNELTRGLNFGQEEARIALEVLHIVDRDLS